MPRRRRRYSQLEYMLKKSNGNIPTSGPLGEYYKYKTGQKELVQSNPIPAEARELFLVGVIPFAVAASGSLATERYLTTMSAYSLVGLQTRSNIPEANFGIYKVEGGEQVNPVYYPALLKVKYAKSGEQVEPNRPSQITGDKYNYLYGRTFSFPFGRTTTGVIDAETGTAETSIVDVQELDVLRSLKTQLAAGTGTREPISFSYEPEDLGDATRGYQKYEAGTTLPSIDVS